MTSVKPLVRLSKHRSAVMPSLAATIFLFGGSTAVAVAGDWKLTDSITSELTFVDRTGRDESSGAVAQITPRLRLNGQGGRSEADIDYALTASIGGGSTDPESLSHDLRARGQVEVIENKFILGANANARLVGNSSTSGNVDAINANSDGSQTYSFEITPEFRHHLNRYADIVSRNSINYVTYSGGNSRSNDDSREFRSNIGVRSGRHFGPLSWSLDATRTKTKFDDRDDERKSYDAGIGYRIDRQWNLRGEVGYEENEVQSSRSDTDGGTWSIGADWNPTNRTSVTADYGKRYLGTVYSGTINHRMRRARLSLDLTRDVSNRRASQFVNSPITLINTSTGQTVTGFIPQLVQTDEDFVNTQLRAVVAVTGRRTTASFSADVSQRDYEVSDLDEDSYGLAVNVSRRLGGGYRASMNSSFSRTEGASDGDGESDNYDVRLSLSKQLSPRTSASVNVEHRNQDGTTSDNGFTENRISISLSSSFL